MPFSLAFELAAVHSYISSENASRKMFERALVIT